MVGIVALGGFAACAGVLIALARHSVASSGRIAPGVRVADVAVGGLAPDVARERVRAWAHAQMANPIVLTAPVSHRRWFLTVGDVGGHFDIDAAIAAATRVGRQGNAWDRLLQGDRSYAVTINPVFGFDSARLSRQLKRVAVKIQQPPRAARAVYDATGGVHVTTPSRPGIDLDIPATQNALLTHGPQSLARGASAILIIRETQPALRDRDLARVDTLLASFHTDFSTSSANRRHNVALAAARIDGTLLAPGEVFSYNAIVGPRTPERGWLEAPTYQDGQVVPGPGGGVCQVSTTLYNAVLRANLPVVMRSHHSMPVHYVEPGRDATVAYDDIDFRFKNNTDAPLLVASPSHGGRLTFNLYGSASAKPAEIALESSPHTPTKDGGFVVSTYRILKHPDGTLERERLSTDTYAPVPSAAPKPNAARKLSPVPHDSAAANHHLAPDAQRPHSAPATPPLPTAAPN